MSERQRFTQVFSEDRQPINVKLTRGAKGQYRWDIQVKAATLDRALQLVKSGDNWLKEHFLQDPKVQLHQSSNPQDSVHSSMDQALKNTREAGKKLLENEGGFK